MGRAIVREPAVFLFDEPLSNLDAKLRVQMRAELQSLHRRLGTTSLFVTHDQVEAMTLAQRMIVMNAGRAEQIGAPLEVYAQARHHLRRELHRLAADEPHSRRSATGARCCSASARSTSSRAPSPRRKLVADIDLIEPLGADTLVYGHLEGGTRIAARLHSSVDARAGKLPLRYRPDAGALLRRTDRRPDLAFLAEDHAFPRAHRRALR